MVSNTTHTQRLHTNKALGDSRWDDDLSVVNQSFGEKRTDAKKYKKEDTTKTLTNRNCLLAVPHMLINYKTKCHLTCETYILKQTVLT